MTPARRAEIRAYIQRLDLDQLPGWTVEQRIIADLWEALEEVEMWTDAALAAAWDEGFKAGEPYGALWQEGDLPPANPYLTGPP
jgi:hypothetical protein